MKIEEYKNIIEQTAIFPEEVKYAYCLLGVNGEFGEFLEKRASKESSREDLIKEAGDVFWYLTACCMVFGVDILNIFPTKEQGDTKKGFTYNKVAFYKRYSRMAEVTKKIYRDRTPLNTELIRDHLAIMILSMYRLTTLSGLDVEEVLEANYKKLIKRRQTNTLHGSGDNREEQ